MNHKLLKSSRPVIAAGLFGVLGFAVQVLTTFPALAQSTQAVTSQQLMDRQS